MVALNASPFGGVPRNGDARERRMPALVTLHNEQGYAMNWRKSNCFACGDMTERCASCTLSRKLQLRFRVELMGGGGRVGLTVWRRRGAGAGVSLVAAGGPPRDEHCSAFVGEIGKLRGNGGHEHACCAAETKQVCFGVEVNVSIPSAFIYDATAGVRMIPFKITSKSDDTVPVRVQDNWRRVRVRSSALRGGSRWSICRVVLSGRRRRCSTTRVRGASSCCVRAWSVSAGTTD